VVIPVSIFLWSSLIAMQNLIAVNHIVWVYVRNLEFFWRRWGSVPLERKRGWPPIETRFCVTVPNLVVLGQRVWTDTYGDWPQKFGPWHSAFQGHSRSSKVRNRQGLIGYQWLLVILCNYEPISYLFRNKRRFWSKFAKFFTHTPCI